MNTIPAIHALVDLTCHLCLQRGRVWARYRGQFVRCKRCLGCFEVPAGGPRLGITVPVVLTGTKSGGVLMRTLGVTRPALDERVSSTRLGYAG